jgi:hypothetical protein
MPRVPAFARYAAKHAREIWFSRMDTSSEHDLKELTEALREAFLAGERHGRKQEALRERNKQ